MLEVQQCFRPTLGFATNTDDGQVGDAILAGEGAICIAGFKKLISFVATMCDH